jgi:hypothetical protein
MKSSLCFLLGLCLSIPLFAQQDSAAPSFPPEELDKLVAPIALYPDSLIALILPSSTTSADVVIAARYFAAGGEQDDIDNQPWADSVKSLAHYPEVVNWMDQNLAWTRQMGEVFAAQPTDVMNAIQRMRAQARAAGLLTDTPQQKIIMQDEEICIVPAEPDVIYVPRYDPEILWMRRPYRGEFITFGFGFGIGSWLFYDCDWHNRGIWVQHRSPGWTYHPGWRHSLEDRREEVGARWHPDSRRFQPARPWHQSRPEAVRPRMIEESHRDLHARPDRVSIQPQPAGPRFGPSVGNPQNRSVQSQPAQHNFNPPAPVNRPHNAPSSQPQPQIQPPHDERRDHRGDNDRPAPQMPHPPSHTPVTHSAPSQVRTPAPAAAPSPAARTVGGTSQPGANSSANGRGSPPQSAPATNGSSRDNGNDRNQGGTVRDNNRR